MLSNRYPSRGDYSDQSGGMSYRSRDKEPLWFTDGPASQSDTIELRGFEPLSESREQNRRESPRELRDEHVGRVGVGNSSKSQHLGELEVKEKVGKSRENFGKHRSSVEEERPRNSSENLEGLK
jgi:Nucleocytoplasmic shuttling protein for mRNA cap-binding EIF4E